MNIFAPTASLTGIDFTALRASLAEGYALPSNWYCDPALYTVERERVLRAGWHFAGHTTALSRPGDQVVCRIAGVPIVLVCGEDGAIRGFVNVCRHRAHQVVLANQNQKSMQCLYHGWTYGLDGRLRAAPRSKHEPCFDAGEFPLLPVSVAQWGPTVWVNVSLDPPAFTDWIAGLPEIVAKHIDVARFRFAFEKSWRIRANWKVWLDNAIECYHCATCHPTLARALDMDPTTHRLSVGTRNWVTTDIPFREKAAPVAPGIEQPRYLFHWIFPTSYFQYTNSGRGFDIGSVTPLSVNEIEFRAVFFVPDDMTDDEVATRMANSDTDPVVGEDIGICERVQQAHEAGIAATGRLLLGSEWHLQHFQKLIVDLMDPPPPTRAAAAE